MEERPARPREHHVAHRYRRRCGRRQLDVAFGHDGQPGLDVVELVGGCDEVVGGVERLSELADAGGHRRDDDLRSDELTETELLVDHEHPADEQQRDRREHLDAEQPD